MTYPKIIGIYEYMKKLLGKMKGLTKEELGNKLQDIELKTGRAEEKFLSY